MITQWPSLGLRRHVHMPMMWNAHQLEILAAAQTIGGLQAVAESHWVVQGQTGVE